MGEPSQTQHRLPHPEKGKPPTPDWGFGVCVEWGAACFLDQHFSCVTQETLLPSLSLPEEVGDPVQPHSRVQPEATQASSLLYLTGQL